MSMSVDEALVLLSAAGVFYPQDEDLPAGLYTLNMNDTWGWAIAWGEEVPKEQIPEVADLFSRYGYPGILYWVSCRHDNMRSEFHDINRFVDFVRREERLRKDVPGSSARAYKKIFYTLGEA